MENVQSENIVEKPKPYELYDLKAKHLFLLIGVIKGINLKQVAAIFRDKIDLSNVDDTEAATRDLGLDTVIELAGVVIDNLPNCQNELYAFLAGVSNLSEEQIADLDVVDFIDMIIDVIRKAEFADFFTRATKLVK